MSRTSHYMDYAATTPCLPEVASAIAACLTIEGNFGNAGSRTHGFGWQAEQAVEVARIKIAKALGATPSEIYWLSGATEANNLAITGSVQPLLEKGEPVHLITSVMEHKAVLEPVRALEEAGATVTRLTPDSNGLISAEAVRSALRAETRLVSLMWVNNEVGAISDVQAIAETLSDHQALFHVDAAQAIGKIKVNLHAVGADLVSVSAHKVYGPKGIGALYIKKGAVLPSPLIVGGGQEKGLRGGTLSVHQIAGMGTAFEIANKEFDDLHSQVVSLRQAFVEGLEGLSGWKVNVPLEVSVPQILSLSFDGVSAESLMGAIPEMSVSTGSACQATHVDPSHVLQALNLSASELEGSLRFSFGRYLTEEICTSVAQRIKEVIPVLRR